MLRRNCWPSPGRSTVGHGRERGNMASTTADMILLSRYIRTYSSSENPALAARPDGSAQAVRVTRVQRTPAAEGRAGPLGGGPGHPIVMGVLNVTPDSFSDGGRYTRLDDALVHARRMHEQ